MGLISASANAAWWGTSARSHALFQRALENPALTQERLLMRHVRRNEATEFGRAHGFESIGSPADFARRVPLGDDESLSPWVSRIAAGEANVLTADRVTRLSMTSGSTGARKLIPYTPGLQREFDRAIAPWIVDLYRSDPQIALGCAYWSVSPVGRRDGATRSTIPIGFEDDAAYVGGVRRRLVDAVMAVPAQLRHVESVEDLRYLTLLLLLRRPDLRLISVWHPSFLTRMLDALPALWPSLLRDIGDGACSIAERLSPGIRNRLRWRADRLRLRDLSSIEPTDFARIWPKLRLISCWTDAHAAGPAEALRSCFPGVRIQAKGLIATEAFVTVPFGGSRPLAVRSHYFEFADLAGSVQAVQALRLGETYGVVVTTGGGLWRYRLHDLVEVTDFVRKTPSFRFVARAGNVSDHFGEKLTDAFVTAVLRDLFAAHRPGPTFAMLAPDTGVAATCYTLYVEHDAVPCLEQALESALRSNPQYAYCRDLGQLGPVRIFRIRGRAFATFSSRLMRHGMRLGDIKPVSLSGRDGWSAHFDGDYVGRGQGS